MTNTVLAERPNATKDQCSPVDGTIPFTREVDAFRFVREELAKGRTVTIWPVQYQAYIFAAQATESVA